MGLLRVGRGGVYDRMRAGSSAWAGWSGGCADVVGSGEVRDVGVRDIVMHTAVGTRYRDGRSVSMSAPGLLMLW